MSRKMLSVISICCVIVATTFYLRSGVSSIDRIKTDVVTPDSIRCQSDWLLKLRIQNTNSFDIRIVGATG